MADKCNGCEGEIKSTESSCVFDGERYHLLCGFVIANKQLQSLTAERDELKKKYDGLVEEYGDVSHALECRTEERDDAKAELATAVEALKTISALDKSRPVKCSAAMEMVVAANEAIAKLEGGEDGSK